MRSMLSLSREVKAQRRTGNCAKQELSFDTWWSPHHSPSLSGLSQNDQMELSDLLVSRVFWKALVMIFSTGHVFDLLASCRPIRECLRVERFIPRQTPASGARRSSVHHCRTYSFGARLCSKVLCYLAYFSSISNGPLPNWSSSCELMVDRGRWEQCPQLSVRTVSRAREEGHQGRNDTLNRWQEPECWPTVGWMISYRKKRGRIELPWPSDCLKQSQNKRRDKYCVDQWEEEIASTAKTRMWVLL